MNVLLFANNRVGLALTKWLRSRGERIVGVVVHPAARQKFRREIVRAAGVPRRAVFDGSRLVRPANARVIAALKPDIGVSIFFGFILKPEILGLFPKGCVNLHPAYLPFNRGAYPNVWSIVDGTPAGATLHYIDVGVDTGHLIARLKVPVLPTDTGGTLYRKLEEACIALFKRVWPAVKSGRARRAKQPRGGTAHRVRDVAELDRIDPDRRYTARRLLNILRARTFPPHRGAYVEERGRRIYLRLELQEEDGHDERD
jgi:methionyl-tRNA formyltransferase